MTNNYFYLFIVSERANFSFEKHSDDYDSYLLYLKTFINDFQLNELEFLFKIFEEIKSNKLETTEMLVTFYLNKSNQNISQEDLQIFQNSINKFKKDYKKNKFWKYIFDKYEFNWDNDINEFNEFKKTILYNSQNYKRENFENNMKVLDFMESLKISNYKNLLTKIPQKIEYQVENNEIPFQIDEFNLFIENIKNYPQNNNKFYKYLINVEDFDWKNDINSFYEFQQKFIFENSYQEISKKILDFIEKKKFETITQIISLFDDNRSNIKNNIFELFIKEVKTLNDQTNKFLLFLLKEKTHFKWNKKENEYKKFKKEFQEKYNNKFDQIFNIIEEKRFANVKNLTDYFSDENNFRNLENQKNIFEIFIEKVQNIKDNNNEFISLLLNHVDNFNWKKKQNEYQKFKELFQKQYNNEFNKIFFIIEKEKFNNPEELLTYFTNEENLNQLNNKNDTASINFQQYKFELFINYIKKKVQFKNQFYYFLIGEKEFNWEQDYKDFSDFKSKLKFYLNSFDSKIYITISENILNYIEENKCNNIVLLTSLFNDNNNLEQFSNEFLKEIEKSSNLFYKTFSNNQKFDNESYFSYYFKDFKNSFDKSFIIKFGIFFDIIEINKIQNKKEFLKHLQITSSNNEVETIDLSNKFDEFIKDVKNLRYSYFKDFLLGNKKNFDWNYYLYNYQDFKKSIDSNKHKEILKIIEEHKFSEYQQLTDFFKKNVISNIQYNQMNEITEEDINQFKNEVQKFGNGSKLYSNSFYDFLFGKEKYFNWSYDSDYNDYYKHLTIQIQKKQIQNSNLVLSVLNFYKNNKISSEEHLKMYFEIQKMKKDFERQKNEFKEVKEKEIQQIKIEKDNEIKQIIESKEKEIQQIKIEKDNEIEYLKNKQEKEIKLFEKEKNEQIKQLEDEKTEIIENEIPKIVNLYLEQLQYEQKNLK